MVDEILWTVLAFWCLFGAYKTGQQSERRKNRLVNGTNNALIWLLRDEKKWQVPISELDRHQAAEKWRMSSIETKKLLRTQASELAEQMNNNFEDDARRGRGQL